MGLFDKKEGGTALGNALRGLKTVAGPMIGIVDELVLGGKIGDAMDLLKGDAMTIEGAPPLTADELAIVAKAISEDVQQARKNNFAKLESSKVPFIAKIIPSIIDLMVMTVWSSAALFMLYTLIKLTGEIASVEGVTRGGAIDATVAVSIFMAIHSHAGNIINYHRGGNSSEQNEHTARMMGRQ